MSKDQKWPHTESMFEYQGYMCVVLLQRLGHRCGYVGLKDDDPRYGKKYGKLDKIECHGGLTYSAGHLLADVPRGMWWIGFDCAHAWDAPDIEAVREIFGEFDAERAAICYNHGAPIRTREYVEAECRNIVDQLVRGIGT